MSLFQRAIEAIDAYNQQDPNKEEENGVLYPKEFLDSQRQSNWLGKIKPEANEALKLATHSQHIGRWEIRRDSYPATRTGYLQWRSDLGKYHAEKSAQLLKEIGYDEAIIERVKFLNQKKNLKLDPDSQIIEDVLCLVFLEFHLEKFAAKHEREKLITILQKTWKKMGPVGKAEALKLPYSPPIAALLQEAL
jgi:hypothetical protein